MPSSSTPYILGLAGGVGSGKSSAARILSRLGAHVIDFDALTQTVLDRPDVRDTLVEWWGPSVLDDRRQVDRAAVAQRIFQSDADRKRLEALIHPLVWRTREQAQSEAVAHHKDIAVMDAPLLFEAGLDRECDAVLFIDTDRAIRLSRVGTNRGWDEAELTRRESAQLPVEQKKARSRFVVANNAGEGELEVAIRRILDIIRESQRHPPVPTP
ncbi:MAG TPA: dephospho-CoA kinase [Phycisphaerales bacterium]|nr:dephospho-CoA kinase [Phycisphaerales bacterium]